MKLSGPPRFAAEQPAAGPDGVSNDHSTTNEKRRFGIDDTPVVLFVLLTACLAVFLVTLAN